MGRQLATIFAVILPVSHHSTFLAEFMRRNAARNRSMGVRHLYAFVV